MFLLPKTPGPSCELGGARFFLYEISCPDKSNSPVRRTGESPARGRSAPQAKSFRHLRLSGRRCRPYFHRRSWRCLVVCRLSSSSLQMDVFHLRELLNQHLLQSIEIVLRTITAAAESGECQADAFVSRFDDRHVAPLRAQHRTDALDDLFNLVVYHHKRVFFTLSFPLFSSFPRRREAILGRSSWAGFPSSRE